jgi:hypothetical protein
MRSPVGELLAALAAALGHLGARWYLFGAQAALLHGAARLTADVDVTVDAGAHELSTLLLALEAEGFAPRGAEVEAFAERTRVIPLEHRASGMAVDLVIAGPGLEQLFLGRAQVRTIEGVSVPIASAEDVLVMKILAGRPKDHEDAVAILAAHPADLDFGLIRSTLGMLDDALSRCDLVPEFERALVRARRKQRE